MSVCAAMQVAYWWGHRYTGNQVHNELSATVLITGIDKYQYPALVIYMYTAYI